MLLQTIRENLGGLILVLEKLSDSQYVEPCADLENATIGQHTRHIIEMFQCLTQSYGQGTINYDNRKRDREIENNSFKAIAEIRNIECSIDKPNKDLLLSQKIAPGVAISTNYFRELLYNLEHSIHHQALIKVALRKHHVEVCRDFGVAPSTIEFRNKCAS